MESMESHPSLRILTDRSRIETYQHCPRERWWRYEYKGRGIQSTKQIPPAWWFLTGRYVHEGVEASLLNADPHNAAAFAVSEYSDAVSPLVNSIEDEATRAAIQAELNEQLWLTESLVTAWVKVGLPEYLTEYEPVAVEQEELLDLEHNLTLMTRTDTLSRRRNDGGLLIHNFKTVSVADKKWREQWAFDQQTLTEYISTEARVGQEVRGVIILGLLKGRRTEYPEDSGIWRHTSPLVYCWVKRGDGINDMDDFRARYKWSCTGPHRLGNGRQCSGFKNHTLSGYHKEPVAECYPGGIQAWIAYLMETDPELVRQQIITLPPINRSPYEVERWKRMVVPVEDSIHRTAGIVNHLLDTGQLFEAVVQLDAHFPMYTGHGNCLRPGQCEFFGTCHRSDNPDDTTLFEPRKPNHELERSKWQGVRTT